MPETLERLVDDFLHAYFAFYPTNAASLGLHEYDGRLPDLRAEAISARIEALHTYRRRLAALDPAAFAGPQRRAQQLDYGLLHWRIEAELWSWLAEREHQRNPIFYAYHAIVDGYVKRNYAPPEARLAALTAHLHQLPEAMATARQNLDQHLPRPLVEEALRIFQGLIAFFGIDLPLAIGVPPAPARHTGAPFPPSLVAQFWAARDKAIVALRAFHSYLHDDALPASHNSFALGAERFAGMLRYNELVTLPLDQLLSLGTADLARNQAALVALATRRAPHQSVAQQVRALGRQHPSVDRVLDETRLMLDDLRRFIRARDLVTLPTEERCAVQATPSFARWAFAMMDSAGPFETAAAESFYYLTLPDTSWPQEHIEGWLSKFDYATLLATSIHEAYPGHYVHFLHIRQAPSRLAKAFWSYAHVESWAHYAEQMMLDEGYGSDDPDLRMAQLLEALVRNCRFICAIRMHVYGMGIAEATRFFMQHAYLDEVMASEEARRGTHDPGYLNYTLGKLMLLKLREDYRAAHPAFSLRRFHDAYIGHGAPPVPLLRALLLPHDDGVVL